MRLALTLTLGVLLTIAAAAVGHQHLTALALDQASARASDEVRVGLVGRVTAGDFAPPFTASRLDQIAERLDPVLAGLRTSDSGILRINLIARDGTVVYSDQREVRGILVESDANGQFDAALNGSVGAVQSRLSSVENSDLRLTHDSALEVYVPVWMDGRIVGAYEIYEDPGLLRALDPLIWCALLACWIVAGAVAWSNRPNRRSASRSAHSPMVLGSRAPSAAMAQDGRVLSVVRPLPVLTRRERQVLQLMTRLPTNREIAAELCVSEETVRSHVKRILHKLQQPGRTQAVAAAIKAGLVELS